MTLYTLVGIGISSPEGPTSFAFRRPSRTYFNAQSETELRKVYENLSTELVLRKEKTEVSGLFAAGAAVLLIVAGAPSLVWFGRVI